MASGAERYEGMGGGGGWTEATVICIPKGNASQGRTGRASGDGRRILGQRSDRASREKLQRQLGNLSKPTWTTLNIGVGPRFLHH